MRGSVDHGQTYQRTQGCIGQTIDWPTLRCESLVAYPLQPSRSLKHCRRLIAQDSRHGRVSGQLAKCFPQPKGSFLGGTRPLPSRAVEWTAIM